MGGIWRGLSKQVLSFESRRDHARGDPQVHRLIAQSGCSLAHWTTSRVGGLVMHSKSAIGRRNGIWNSSQCCGSAIRHARTTSSTTSNSSIAIAAALRLCDRGGV
jgi:hypothetical protein